MLSLYFISVHSAVPLQVQRADIMRQYEHECTKLTTLQFDRNQLQASLISANKRLADLEKENEIMRNKVKVAERSKVEVQEARQRVAELELSLAESRRAEIQSREDLDMERLKSAVARKDKQVLVGGKLFDLIT